MNKPSCIFSIFLLISFTSVKGQTIEQLGHYSTDDEIWALSSKPNLMVLGNGDIVDISNPLMPELISTFSDVSYSRGILVSEDYAYFGHNPEMGAIELIIADISNPYSPLQISSLSFHCNCDFRGSGIGGLVKSDNIIYFVTMFGIGVIDVSNSAPPSVKDTLNYPEFMTYGINDIVIKTSYAYIAAGYDGLRIVDISNPSNMQEVASIGSYDFSYTSIDINDSLVFLGKSKYEYSGGTDIYTAGIEVFNISDPLNPYPAFSIPDYPGYIRDIKYHENHIYVIDDSRGLSIYKIENNAGIEIANFPGEYSEVCLQDSLILLSGSNGVDILHYDNPDIVGVKSLSLNRQIKIFPNPASEDVTFNLNVVSNSFTLELFDIRGRKMISQKIRNGIPVSVQNLDKGLYLYKLYDGEILYTGKLMVE